ncbi:MAG TPA: sensor histidine kinase [Burkholderiaceae bacterium]
MPAVTTFFSATPVLDLKRRLFCGIVAGTALIAGVAALHVLEQARVRIAADVGRLGSTLGQFALKELRFVPGQFQYQLAPVDLDVFQGIGLLLPFCVEVEDIHGQALSQRCFGDPGNAPPFVVAALTRAMQGAPVARIRLNRHPGIKVGEMVVSPHLQAEAGLLWQQWQLLLVVAAGLVVISMAVYATVRRALHPTHTMLATLARMEGGDLQARMPHFALVELDRIGRVFNQLADRLQHTIAGQRELADRLLRVREEERRHLSRELHDEFGQSLASINAEAAYAGEVARESLPGLVTCTDAISRATTAMMDTLQHLVRRLRPPDLDAFGLEASLRQMLEGGRHRAGGRCQCVLQTTGPVDRVPDAMAVHLYRLVQESLTNALRHGQATRVDVALAVTDDAVRLTVVDNGQARSVPVHPPGHGLLGMHERVLALGGEIVTQVCQPHGWQVGVWLPLSREAA